MIVLGGVVGHGDLWLSWVCLWVCGLRLQGSYAIHFKGENAADEIFCIFVQFDL